MIGENIQSIRKQKGLSLSECAQRATISKSYLSNIERGINQNPSIQIIERIATVLDADLRTLLGTKPVDDLVPENEWLDFVEELKESGVDKGELQKYKTVIEFAKWQNDKSGKKT